MSKRKYNYALSVNSLNVNDFNNMVISDNEMTNEGTNEVTNDDSTEYICDGYKYDGHGDECDEHDILGGCDSCVPDEYMGDNILYDVYYDIALINKIIMKNNHIYFKSIVNDETIDKLIEDIEIIIYYFMGNGNGNGNGSNGNGSNSSSSCSSNKIIYLHINSLGGNVKSLQKFIEYKKICTYEIISIVEYKCMDCGFILAALCDYRIVQRKAICMLTYNTFAGDYWGAYKQSSGLLERVEIKNYIYDVLCYVVKTNRKLTVMKLDKYFQKNNIWDSRKYRKLGFADEVI